MASADIPAPGSDAVEGAHFVQDLLEALSDVVVGQKALAERLLTALLAGGHVLLEGGPGLAKTLLVRSMAQATQAEFARIRFSPDLLPADLVGTQMYNHKTGKFRTRRGPILANIVLVEEVNCGPGRLQSALLEAVQERQVTVDGIAYQMQEPFLVVATQNSIRHPGTYPLTDTLLDRFMFKMVVSYPQPNEEWLILDRMTGAPQPPLAPVAHPAQISRAREKVEQVYVSDGAKDYALDVILATREPGISGLQDLSPMIARGASPRAGMDLVRAARARAFVNGRSHVTAGDVKSVAPDVLRHRVIVTDIAAAQRVSSADVVQRILNHVRVS